VSSTFVEMPVVVHEFIPAPSDEPAPVLFNRRAKIWRQAMPPDQLNPAGHIDGDLAAFMPTQVGGWWVGVEGLRGAPGSADFGEAAAPQGWPPARALTPGAADALCTCPQGRATMRKGARAAGGPMSIDERAGFLPLPLPPPGDPDADVSPGDMTWTILADLSAAVTVRLLDAAAPPVFGFAVREADRQGSISIPRCDVLKIQPGAHARAARAGLRWLLVALRAALRCVGSRPQLRRCGATGGAGWRLVCGAIPIRDSRPLAPAQNPRRDVPAA
jgi:hypothetical protein